MKRRSSAHQEAVLSKAEELRILVRTETSDDGVMKLRDFDGDKLLYYRIRNRAAAVSAAVPSLRAAGFNFRGLGLTVSFWGIGIGA